MWLSPILACGSVEYQIKEERDLKYSIAEGSEFWLDSSMHLYIIWIFISGLYNSLDVYLGSDVFSSLNRKIKLVNFYVMNRLNK